MRYRGFIIHPLLRVILVHSVKNVLIFLHGQSWLCCPDTYISMLQCLPLWGWITVYNGKNYSRLHVHVQWMFGSFTYGCTNLWKPYETNWLNSNSYDGLLTTSLWDILRIVAQYSPYIITPERRSFLGLNYVSIHCHVISKDSRFKLVKQLRPDTFRFTDRRFQSTVRINRVNFSQGDIKFSSS